jgi:hypothetical protein
MSAAEARVTGGESLKVEVNGTSKVVNRPTSEVRFDGLPVGNLVFTATVYTETNGGGEPVGEAQGIVSILANDTASKALSADDTSISQLVIAQVVVTPELTVEKDQTLQLTVCAVSATGDVVIVAPGSFTWESSDIAVATVGNNTGKVTGVSVGAAEITAVYASGEPRVTVALTVTDSAIRLTDYWPLHVGDESFMRDVATGTLGRSVVTGTTTIDGSSAWVWRQESETGTPLEESYFRIGAQGLEWVGVKALGGGHTFNAHYVPPMVWKGGEIGSENSGTVTMYDWDGTEKGTETYRVRLLAFENVVVPAGNFSRCLKAEMYEQRSPGDTQTNILWLAPGVGGVKRDYVNHSTGRTVSQVLVYAKVGDKEYGTHP